MMQPAPSPPLIDRITRLILADKPRVTRFPVRWDNGLDEREMPAELMQLAEEEANNNIGSIADEQHCLMNGVSLEGNPKLAALLASKQPLWSNSL